MMTWREAGGEHHHAVSGVGLLAAVSGGVGDDTAEAASLTAVRVLAKLYGTEWPRKPARVLKRYVEQSHDELHAHTRARGQVMGASLTAIWSDGQQAGWVHVGDTRLYLFRGGRLTRLSADHTIGEFARRRGRITQVDAEVVIQRFMQGSAGLGDNDSLHLEMGLDAGVETLEPQDRLLLCTRGVGDAVDDASLADVLRNVPDAQAASVALMERAIARGSRDNLTAMVIRVGPAPDENLG